MLQELAARIRLPFEGWRRHATGFAGIGKAVTLTEFLYPTPSVLYGIGRLMDLGAELDSYNFSLTPEEADAVAIYSDWFMVGTDFKAAIQECLSSHPHIQTPAQ